MTRHRRLRIAAEASAVVLACLALVAVSHDVGYILHAPYWLDEAWVAVSARLPVGDLLQVTSSTPPGWNLLQRVFTPFGLQAARLLPLGFIAASGVVAYYAARVIVRERVPLPRLVGAAAAIAVIVLPASLARNDLKQYTGDGFVALAVVLCLALAERSGWSRRSLWVLAAVGSLGFAVSITAIFPVAAAGLTWLLSCALRRRLRAFLDGLLPFGVLLAALALLFLFVYAPASNSALNDYWAAYYPTVGELPGYLLQHARGLGPLLLFGRWWVTALGAVAAVALIALRWRSVVALFPVALGVLAIAAGVARRYPLLDTRTSHFLLVTATFFAAVGIVGGLLVVATFAVRRAGLLWAVALPVTAVLISAAVTTSASDMRAHTIPPEDVRSQIAYVAQHSSADDVILLNRYAGYGFGYYWRADDPSWVHDSGFATAFQIAYPDVPRIVIAGDDDTSWIGRAEALAAERGGRVWVIRTHVATAVRASWDAAMPDARSIPVGTEPLTLVGR
jgi:hypothetical protein